MTNFNPNNVTAAPDPNAVIRRVLIVGVSGYLGSALAYGLRDEFEVFGTYNTHPIRIDGVTSFQLNCIQGGEILDLLNRIKPEAVIYCAGLTNPDDCQNNPALAESMHFKAPAVFFKILPMVLRFVFFSPDDSIGAQSSAEPFQESQIATPQTVLAKTRHQGETACLNAKRYTAVFRLGEVFGESFGWNAHAPEVPDPNGETARIHWLDKLQSQLARGRQVSCSPDEIRSYLYVGDFVRAVKLYLRQAPVEAVLYHLAGRTPISQLEFARELCKKFGYNPALVRSKGSIGIPSNYSLNSTKFENDFSFQFQDIDGALEEFSERLRTGFTKNWR